LKAQDGVTIYLFPNMVGQVHLAYLAYP